MNISQVDSVISQASRLMNADFMNKVDSAAARRNGKSSKYGNDDLTYLDEQVFGYNTRNTDNYTQQNIQIQQKPAQHKFNNNMLQESFAKNPPISGANFPGAETMGLTASGYQPGASLLAEQQKYVQQSQYVQQPQYGTIDYTFIKHLVSEAIKENMETIKQSILTENTLRAINMPGGNKIQFLDSKGNLYEGQLVMKRKKK